MKQGKTGKAAGHMSYKMIITRRRANITVDIDRHMGIIILTYLTEESHGERPQDRSETAGTQAHRHAEPIPDRRHRHFVSRESVFRLQRPSASSLRDAAAPPRGRQFH